MTVGARQKGLELNYRVAAGVPDDLRGDPGRLRQILVNLLGNAVKFTERGEVNVTIERESGDAETVWLRFSVADSGIGIPADRLETIFKPFAQGDASITRRYGGTGLGLTIARQLVEMMQGRITVESAVGHGSTFHVRMPFGVVRTPRPALPPAPPSTHSVRENRLVLVAEDNRVNQSLALHLLERHGYQVELAVDGREAVEKFKRRPFAAILMDVQMPEMDGFTATAAIRELEKNSGAHVPIIAITAHAMKGDRERCLSAGMDGYLSKPVRPSELYDLLDQVVARVEPVA
jgi:CheY-like chemotaxis protein/anti-sigma regulatory factor (Ser/Thr protein kinase)